MNTTSIFVIIFYVTSLVVAFVFCVHTTVRSLNLIHKYDESSASLPNFSSLKQKLERKYYSYLLWYYYLLYLLERSEVGVE